MNWQVTATTIYCQAVDDEVTIMVFKDATVKCTGYKKYHEPTRETKRLIKAKSGQLGRELRCEGPECPQVTQYRDRLFAEEGQGGSK